MHVAVIPVGVAHGHANPISTVAKALQERGHEITLLGYPAISKFYADKFGFSLRSFGDDMVEQQIEEYMKEMSNCKDIEALDLGIKASRLMNNIFLSEFKDGKLLDGIDAILADETLNMPLSCITELHKKPVVYLSAMTLIYEDAYVPHFSFTWQPPTGPLGRIFHRLVYYGIAKLVYAPLAKEIHAFRDEHGLEPIDWGAGRPWVADAVTDLVRLRLTQMPNHFDFPRSMIPDTLFYTQPWVKSSRDATLVPFDWTKIDGRPIIFVTLGTVQNGYFDIYRKISELMLSKPDYQMILTLGRPKQDRVELPDNFPVPPGAIFANYVPQVEIIKKTTAVISVGGMNTILEAAKEGVPLVAIPLGSDQPSNAARAKRQGFCEIVDKRPSTNALKHALEKILSDTSYKQAALAFQRKLNEGPTLEQTAELIEYAIQADKPVVRSDPGARNIYGSLGDPVDPINIHP